MTSEGIAVASSPVGCVGEALRMRDPSKERSIARGAEHAASAAGQGAGMPGGGSVEEAWPSLPYKEWKDT
jgi:hypothetical protein